MEPRMSDLPEHVIRTADRLARRMGGRFVLNKEATPMTTDLPELKYLDEAARAAGYQIANALAVRQREEILHHTASFSPHLNKVIARKLWHGFTRVDGGPWFMLAKQHGENLYRLNDLGLFVKELLLAPPVMEPDLPGEIWKQCPSVPAYQVSNLGRMRRTERIAGCRWPIGKILTPKLSKGYPKVNVMIAGKRVNKRVHTLVMEAFRGPTPDGMEIAHLNGDSTDPRLDNLQYVTHAENEAHKVLHNSHNRGVRNGQSKLTEDQARAILLTPKRRGTITQLAREYGVSGATVSDVLSGKKWGWLQAEFHDSLRPLPSPPKGDVA